MERVVDRNGQMGFRADEEVNRHAKATKLTGFCLPAPGVDRAGISLYEAPWQAL